MTDFSKFKIYTLLGDLFYYRFKWCQDRCAGLKSRRQWDSEETRGAVQLYGDAVWSCPCCNPHTSGCGAGFWYFPISSIAMLRSIIWLSECGVPHIAGNCPKNNYFLWWSNRCVEFCIYEHRWWKLQKMRNLLLNGVQYECDRCSAWCWGNTVH